MEEDDEENEVAVSVSLYMCEGGREGMSDRKKGGGKVKRHDNNDDEEEGDKDEEIAIWCSPREGGKE